MSQELVTVDPAAHAITNFVPGESKAKVAKIDAMIAYAAKVKDTALMERAADAKVAEVNQLVAWWDANVQSAGGDRQSIVAGSATMLSVSEATEACGFSKFVISRWQKALQGDFRQTLMNRMMAAAGLIERGSKSEEQAERELADILDKLDRIVETLTRDQTKEHYKRVGARLERLGEKIETPRLAKKAEVKPVLDRRRRPTKPHPVPLTDDGDRDILTSPSRDGKDIRQTI